MTNRINEATARKLASKVGIKVSKVTTHTDGSRTLSVGDFIVRHDGKGGKACWKVFSGEVEVHHSHVLYVGEAIERAALLAQWPAPLDQITLAGRFAVWAENLTHA